MTYRLQVRPPLRASSHVHPHTTTPTNRVHTWYLHGSPLRTASASGNSSRCLVKRVCLFVQRVCARGSSTNLDGTHHHLASHASSAAAFTRGGDKELCRPSNGYLQRLLPPGSVSHPRLASPRATSRMSHGELDLFRPALHLAWLAAAQTLAYGA